MPAPTEPTTTSRDARFWDRIAERYARRPVADEAAYREKLRITRTYLTPAAELLEFGCGTGSTALAHAPFVRDVLAIDVSAKMIEIAQRKAAADGVANVTFRRATLDDPAVTDRRFDVVLGLGVLHLLRDRDAAIAQVYGLLKTGGVFVSNTACLGDRMAWFALVAPLGRALGVFPYVRVFGADALDRSLTSAGFEIAHRWRPPRGHAVFLVARRPR